MCPVLRALPLALGSLVLALFGRAQPAERPAIFAPVPPQLSAQASNRAVLVPRAPLSDRLRQAMNEQILATAKTFELPTDSVVPVAAPPIITSDGTVLMQRFVVRSLVPRREDVEASAAALPKFEPVNRWWSDPRTTPAYSATLLRMFGGAGLLNLNVLNGAAQGVDHQRDFTRVELEFSFRW